MSRFEEAQIAHKALADLHTELLALHKQAKARFRELPSWALIRRESCDAMGSLQTRQARRIGRVIILRQPADAVTATLNIREMKISAAYRDE